MITLLPASESICATEYPSRLLRMWPRCSGLLVLGDEYSTITVLPVGEPLPKSASATTSASLSPQNALLNERFRKPLMTL